MKQNDKNDLQRQRIEGVYQKIDKRHKDGDLVTAALGLASESGEVAQIMRDCIDRGKRLNYGELAVELCDVAHYLALACSLLDCTIDDLLLLNDAKMYAMDNTERAHFEQEMAAWNMRETALKKQADKVKGGIIPLPHFEHQ